MSFYFKQFFFSPQLSGALQKSSRLVTGLDKILILIEKTVIVYQNIKVAVCSFFI